MKPTVGRIVHYQSFGVDQCCYPMDGPASVPQAALITGVNTDPAYPPNTVALCVFKPTGLSFLEYVYFSETPQKGFWSWPPREAS